MFPMRSFLDAGLRPTDSSDYTASPLDPMVWLQSQLTRADMKGNVWGANQRITLQEGIRCGTINGAYAAFEEDLKGSIQPGQLADLVVLAQDPFKTDPSGLLKIEVERTMVRGTGNMSPDPDRIARIHTSHAVLGDPDASSATLTFGLLQSSP